MKKILVFVLVFSAFCYYKSVSEEHKKIGPQSLFAKATTPDGRIELSVLFNSNLLPEERREAYLEADLDGDGYLTQEEYDLLPDMASNYERELTCRLATNAAAKPCQAPFFPLPAASCDNRNAATCPQMKCPQTPCSAPICPQQSCAFSFDDADADHCQARNLKPRFDENKRVGDVVWKQETDRELHDLESEIYSRLEETLENTLALQTTRLDAFSNVGADTVAKFDSDFRVM